MRLGCILLSMSLTLATTLRADDWPQWLGPQRDGVWREKGLIEKFPESGAKVKWRVPVRGGYAGPAVANGKVFLMDFAAKPGAPKAKNPFDRTARPGTERVLCMNEADGKVLWSHEYDVAYGVSYGSGPRTTPSVDGDRVYTLGAEGHLHCLSAADGKVLWSKALSGENAPTPTWGFAGHPLIDGEKLIVLAADKSGVAAAFDKITGQPLWSAVAAKEPGYAPPMIYTLGGKRQLILWHPASVNSLDPETGSLNWTVPHGPVQNGVAIATPSVELVDGQTEGKSHQRLAVTSAYTGMMLLGFEAGAAQPKVLWHRMAREGSRKAEAIHSLMVKPTIYNGHIYGTDINGAVRCLDAKTGEIVWETYQATTGGDRRMWATAFLTPTGDFGQWFLANDQGDLIIASITPEGYKELSRTHVLQPTNAEANVPVVWSHPAYANRSIFWRNDKELVCVDAAR